METTQKGANAMKAARRTASSELADRNSRIIALCDAIKETLKPAHGAQWGDVGDAGRCTTDLLRVYAYMTSREHGDKFTLPSDGGRDAEIEFTVNELV